MNDMTQVIVPKSDQINADDLIGGPRVITITEIDIRPGTEQPVSIFFDGCDGKPWKPCKSMSRVLVAAWGPDAKAYVGRSVRLYRDPTVKWGGMEVGGIRISHMTDLERDMSMALTATKGKRAPFTVKALNHEAKADKVADGVRDLLARIRAGEDVTGDEAVTKQRAWLSKNRPDLAAEIDTAISLAAQDEEDPFAGPTDEQRGEAHSDAEKSPAQAKADEIIEAAGRVELKADYDRLVFDSAEHIAAMPSDLADLVQGALDGAEKRLGARA